MTFLPSHVTSCTHAHWVDRRADHVIGEGGHVTSLTSWRAACDISARSFGLPTNYEWPIYSRKSESELKMKEKIRRQDVQYLNVKTDTKRNRKLQHNKLLSKTKSLSLISRYLHLCAGTSF